jgi:hypothetical protein
VNFDVQGVDRLAVLRFAGKPEVASAVRSHVLSELEQGGFYTTVDEGTALSLGQNVAYLGQADQLKAAMVQARDVGVDAVLAARLRGQAESGSVAGPFQANEPSLSVELSYDLIHVPTGRILAQQTIRRDHVGEFTDELGASLVIEEVARRLAMECGSELVRQITAHPESVEILLAGSSWPASGAGLVSDGNQAAAVGDWKNAVDFWHAALKEGPTNHAAMYNLGVAFERAADHEGAVHWYSKAVAEKEAKQYQQALARAEAGLQQYHLAQVQVRRPRRGQVLPAGSSPADPGNLLGRPADSQGGWYR